MSRAAIVALALASCRAPGGATSVVPPDEGSGVPRAPTKPASATPAKPAVAAPSGQPSALPGPALPGRVTVGFTITPVVGDAPPTLRVRVHNPSARPVPMTRFADGACFVRHYLELALTRPGGEPQALKGCTPRRGAAGRDEPLAAGGELQVVVPLAELASDWPRGTYRVQLRWDPRELAAARGEAAAVEASQTALNTEDFTIARALATVRVERGASVRLPDGLQFRFTGHAHKHVGPDETSPLMIHADVTPPGASRPLVFTTNLHSERSTLFTVEGGWTFELVDHAYDEWMQLRYYGRIAARR